MQTRRIIVIAAAILVGLVALSNAARERIMDAPVLDGDNLIFRDSYHLDGETDEALLVVASSITLTERSRVDGSAALLGEEIRIAGEIDDELTAAGKRLIVEESAEIDGDALLMGSEVLLAGVFDGDVTVTTTNLTIEPGAHFDGSLTVCAEMTLDRRDPPGTILPCRDIEPPPAFEALRELGGVGGIGGLRDVPFEPRSPAHQLADAVISTLFLSLVLGGLGGLAVTFFPRQISNIEEAVRTMPRHLIVTGLMVGLAAVGLTTGFVVVLAVFPPLGVLLLPVIVLGGLVYLGMWLAGVTTIALIVGDWLLSRSGSGVPPLAAVVVGSGVLAAGLHLVALIPFGFLFSFVGVTLVGVIAVGAAYQTRIGTRPLHRSYFVQG